MKMKTWIMGAMLMASTSWGAPVFTTEGRGYTCYQDYPHALANAKNEADTKARYKCGQRATKRLTDFIIEQKPQACLVIVYARYACL